MSATEGRTSTAILDVISDRRVSKTVSITTTGAIIREDNEHSLT